MKETKSSKKKDINKIAADRQRRLFLSPEQLKEVDEKFKDLPPAERLKKLHPPLIPC